MPKYSANIIKLFCHTNDISIWAQIGFTDRYFVSIVGIDGI